MNWMFVVLVCVAPANTDLVFDKFGDCLYIARSSFRRAAHRPPDQPLAPRARGHRRRVGRTPRSVARGVMPGPPKTA
jgi:hypothetical protein